MAVDIAEKIFERLAIRIRIDKHEPAPLTDADFLQAVGFFAYRRKIPLAWHFFQLAVQLPGPAMEGAAKRLLTFFVIIANSPATVHTAVGKRLDLVFGDPDNQKGKSRDIIDESIADFLYIILVASHLPDAFPEPLDFPVMFFLGPVTADLDGGNTRFHR